ncbi:uncharacterized protein LOC135209382 [Macrobrachium nipponense]|uniref:uncharacterized protein LOC135209382 n=1 Tax=Macrobrachium nipponense TaxID=159736 RepID=UPI0030C8273B
MKEMMMNDGDDDDDEIDDDDGNNESNENGMFGPFLKERRRSRRHRRFSRADQIVRGSRLAKMAMGENEVFEKRDRLAAGTGMDPPKRLEPSSSERRRPAEAAAKPSGPAVEASGKKTPKTTPQSRQS